MAMVFVWLSFSNFWYLGLLDASTWQTGSTDTISSYVNYPLIYLKSPQPTRLIQFQMALGTVNLIFVKYRPKDVLVTLISTHEPSQT